MFRRAGSLSIPSSRSGALRWKKLSAWDCTICARFISRRSLAAAGGMVTARIASPALDEAMRWLTGQMPQIRAVIPGISQNGRPSQNFSKPRNSATWNRASATCPVVVEVDRDLGVPLDPRNGVDYDSLSHGLSFRSARSSSGQDVSVSAELDLSTIEVRGMLRQSVVPARPGSVGAGGGQPGM